MPTGQSPSLTRALELALQYLGFGQNRPKRVTDDVVSAVRADGGLEVDAAGVPLRTSGVSKAPTPGARVPVLWTRQNLAPGQRGVRPAVILRHQARRAQTPSVSTPVGGTLEELFLGFTVADGKLDVIFRNEHQVTPLRVWAAPISGTDPELAEVYWGAANNTFMVRLSATLPSGEIHGVADEEELYDAFVVFRLNRSASTALGQTTATATFVKEVRVPFWAEMGEFRSDEFLSHYYNLILLAGSMPVFGVTPLTVNEFHAAVTPWDAARNYGADFPAYAGDVESAVRYGTGKVAMLGAARNVGFDNLSGWHRQRLFAGHPASNTALGGPSRVNAVLTDDMRIVFWWSCQIESFNQGLAVGGTQWDGFGNVGGLVDKRSEIAFAVDAEAGEIVWRSPGNDTTADVGAATGGVAHSTVRGLIGMGVTAAFQANVAALAWSNAPTGTRLVAITRRDADDGVITVRSTVEDGAGRLASFLGADGPVCAIRSWAPTALLLEAYPDLFDGRTAVYLVTATTPAWAVVAEATLVAPFLVATPPTPNFSWLVRVLRFVGGTPLSVFAEPTTVYGPLSEANQGALIPVSALATRNLMLGLGPVPDRVVLRRIDPAVIDGGPKPGGGRFVIDVNADPARAVLAPAGTVA